MELRPAPEYLSLRGIPWMEAYIDDIGNAEAFCQYNMYIWWDRVPAISCR